MNNILDWRFNKLITPKLMQVVHGMILVLSLIAGIVIILGSLYGLVEGAEIGALGILGGIGVAVVIPAFSRLLHEVAIITFRIASVSRDVDELLKQRMMSSASPAAEESTATPPPLPPLQE